MDMAEERLEIEELLSCRLDSEISERQENQFRRLLQHNRSIAEDYRRLERQKQLLNALPAASAPAGLVNNVKASVERKSILGEYPGFGGEERAGRQLYMRRMLAVAAMVLLPLGILTFVIFSILSPAHIDSTGRSPTADFLKTPGTAVSQPTLISADAASFTASVELATGQAIGVNSFIEKAIYSNSLIDKTIPVRRTSQSSFYIICQRSRMERLLLDITSLWQKCRSVRLTLHGTTPEDNIVIENISAEQMLTLFGTDRADERKALAAHFARYNTIVRSLPGHGILALQAGEGTAAQIPVIPVKPIFTSDAANTGEVTSDTDTGEKISLIIAVSAL